MSMTIEEREAAVLISGYRFFIKMTGDKKYTCFNPKTREFHINKIFHTYFEPIPAMELFDKITPHLHKDNVTAIKLVNPKGQTVKEFFV